MMISFIISIWNGAANLERCLESIIGQTSSDWEIIVIDGGSKDGSVDILKRYNDRIAYWISEADKGIYDAWNKALPHVRGDWFHFLGTDDFLEESTVIERIEPHLVAAFPAHRIVYGQINTRRMDGVECGCHGQPWELIREKFCHEMCIPHQAAFHHRSLIYEGRRFDSSMPYAGDYDFLLTEVLHTSPLFVSGIIVATWTLGGATSSPRHALTVLKDMRRAQAKHGITPERRAWWRYVKAVVKSMTWKWLGAGAASFLTDVWRRVTMRKPLGRLD